MKAMTTEEMLRKLEGVREGSELFISYVAGRTASAKARAEARVSDEMGISPRHYVGTFKAINMNRHGEVTMTVFVANRDNSVTGEVGAFRTFNPSVGRLLTLEILQA
jgi:hypothetical protein